MSVVLRECLVCFLHATCFFTRYDANVSFVACKIGRQVNFKYMPLQCLSPLQAIEMSAAETMNSGNMFVGHWLSATHIRDCSGDVICVCYSAPHMEARFVKTSSRLKSTINKPRAFSYVIAQRHH